MYFRALKIAKLVSTLLGTPSEVRQNVLAPSHPEATPRVVWEVRTSVGVTFRPELGCLIVISSDGEEALTGYWHDRVSEVLFRGNVLRAAGIKIG